MLENLLQKTSAGLYCSKGDFYLDPKKAVNHSLVSHAHGDHAVPTPGMVFCTIPTRSFMEHRFGERSKVNYVNVEFGKPFFLNDVKITFFPAGHILGSAQILMEYEGIRYLYTGDFKVQADESCEKFQLVECDCLVTETTFASPEFSHPEAEDEIKKLFKENDKVIIGAYSLGKSQRISHLISKIAPEVNIFIHDEPGAFHKLYEKHGFIPGQWRPFRRADFDQSQKAAYIVPPAYFRKYVSDGVLRVFATGWKRSFYRCDRVLSISDHADWQGVLYMIKQTKAKKIYTVHGNGKHLQDFLKDSIEVNIIG